MNIKIVAPAFTLMSTALLSACGGGGSSSTSAVPAPAPVTSAQGVYEGSTSSGFTIDTLVLDDDSYWTIYGSQSGSTLLVSGFIQGTGKSNNGSFNSTDVRDFYMSGMMTSGTMTATYSPGASFNGTTSNGTQSVSFTSKAMTGTLYNYNTAPVMANITGAWTMTEMSGATLNLNIGSSGTFSGTSSGCSFNGSLTPRPSGKNVYNLIVNFGAAPCQLANQSATGIALDYLLANGMRELILAGVNASRTSGTVVFGMR